jgi:hypothetical protein
MTTTVDLSDPYGDPFAEDIHDPVVFALNGTSLLHERAQTVRQKFESHLAQPELPKNILALSARKRMVEPVSRLAEATLIARMAAGRLRGLAEDVLDAAIAVWNDAYATAQKILTEVERLVVFLLTPDHPGQSAPEPPLPPLHDWATVSAQVQIDVATRTAAVRGMKGQMIIAKPSPGTGKCLGRGTPVIMYDGRVVPVEKVGAGDLLMGPDSQPRRVLSTNREHGALRRIVPVKGDAWICNDVHVMTLVYSIGGDVSDISLDEFEKLPAYKREKFKLFQPDSVQFPTPETPAHVSPYFLGVWLGDGTHCGDERRASVLGGVAVSKPDPEIERACHEEAERWDLRCVNHAAEDKCPTFALVGREWRHNPLLTEMRALMRDGIRIPPRYLLGSRQERLELLAGLLDTDGHLTNGCYEIVQLRPQLADDITFLARSLGFRVTSRPKIVNGASYVRMFISGDGSILPLRIPRKISAPRRINKNALRTGFVVENAGEGDFFGFTLDGDGRFMLGDFTVTHNTKAMVDTALREQAQRQRIVVAVRTKQVLVDELEPRVRKAGSMQVRLHVIQGRDEGTCWNYDNVKAVQAHGYAPGSTVCSRCEYHPDIAKKLRTFSVCPYYRSRQNAQNDTASARFRMNDYPLILTTHAGYLAAVESGGGRFGKFWPCDLLMMDEDPTEAFEPEVIIKPEHLVLPTPPKPEDRAAHAMAAMMEGAIAQATIERKAMEAVGWKANGKASEIHSRNGSAYAGLALHKLLDRVAAGHVGQQRGFQSVLQVLRDVSDSHVHPASGALHGATTAASVSLVVPPRGLSQIGEALFEEHALRMQLRRLAYKKIHESEMPSTLTAAQVGAELAESEGFDSVYRVRLECVKDEWRFVFQNFVNMLDQATNTLLGDAYANVEHCRQVFDKPATMQNDPSYVDPVTVINRVAHFPDDSTVIRVRTQANITYLKDEGWGEHASLIAEVLRTLTGKRVLIYGHTVLKPRVEKLFADNENFGVSEWAFENWGGGRGKDEYGHFDAVVTISDYIQNIGGMLHRVNARAARETARLLTRGRNDDALAEGTRIRLDMNKADIAHKMTAPDTHWRIKQEHERVNVSELAQGLHRVRGLRSGKRMIVIGDGVPFTKDTVAASVVVNPVGGPRGRSKLKSGYIDGGLTADENYDALCQIEEHFGCYSPAFLHALFAMEMGVFLGDNRLGVTRCQDRKVELYRDSLNRVQLIAPDSLSHHPQSRMPGDRNSRVPGDHQDDREPLTGDQPGAGPESAADTAAAPPTTVPADEVRVVVPMLRRVWDPTADWKSLSRLANQRLQRTRLASQRVSREFPFSGRYVPSWEDSTHTGYMWYSRHSAKTGAATFVDIIENQYGINKNGVLIVPNRKAFVPF